MDVDEYDDTEYIVQSVKIRLRRNNFAHIRRSQGDTKTQGNFGFGMDLDGDNIVTKLRYGAVQLHDDGDLIKPGMQITHVNDIEVTSESNVTEIISDCIDIGDVVVLTFQKKKEQTLYDDFIAILLKMYPW
jgi:hypothetical protein